MAKNKFRARNNASRARPIAVVVLLHVALIVSIAWQASPNCDELAHLASGFHHWQCLRFDAYRVNPPLFRLWCTTPVALTQRLPVLRIDASAQRPEWSLATQLLESTTPGQLRAYLFTARLTGVPWIVLGGAGCYRWAKSRYGSQAAFAALVLWCFSPNVLSWGATLCPDMAAASIGIVTCFAFNRWLHQGTWKATLSCGILLGMSVLTKSTWVTLFVVFPLLMLFRRRLAGCSSSGQGIRRGTCLLLISVWVINLGYVFDGSFSRIGNDPVRSEPVTSSLFGEIPSPLPKPLVAGLQQQRQEFVRGKWSYLCGEWRHGGWYSYYAICALFKIPLGLWFLLLQTLVIDVAKALRTEVGQYPVELIVDRLALSLPPIAIALVVSSQVGFSRHFRYVFPCLPFLIVWVSQAAAPGLRRRPFQLIGVTSVIWFVASSISSWPFCHSYFNRLAGGPAGGYRFLLDANLDWGEDVLHAEKWVQENRDAAPVYRGFITDEFAAHRPCRWHPEPANLVPGWYLVSIHRVLDPSDRFSVLRHFEPVARIGYSTIVFHLKPSDVRALDAHCLIERAIYEGRGSPSELIACPAHGLQMVTPRLRWIR